MNSFPKDLVLAECVKYGPLLLVDDSLNGAKVMAAIATIESSLGDNCGPRYEERYDMEGTYAQDPTQEGLLKLYGRAAACSYGPWQVMLVNCPGYAPHELEANLHACARSFISHFNNFVIRHWKAISLDHIGQVWNGGHRLIVGEIVPPAIQRYCEELTKAYLAVEVS